MSFCEIPHTADVRIRARAPTLEGLFSEAVSALMQTMYGEDRRGEVQRTVTLGAGDRESLLHDLLSEILYLSDADSLVFASASVKIRGDRVEAILSGEPFDRKRHAAGTEVKGISYSGLAIIEDANGYMLDIVFDV